MDRITWGLKRKKPWKIVVAVGVGGVQPASTHKHVPAECVANPRIEVIARLQYGFARRRGLHWKPARVRVARVPNPLC